MNENQPEQADIPALLAEIRDGQREIIDLLARQHEIASEQRDIAAQQLQKSRLQVEESIGLQRDAVRRFRVVSMIAIPGIVACIGAIVYLVVRYF